MGLQILAMAAMFARNFSVFKRNLHRTVPCLKGQRGLVWWYWNTTKRSLEKVALAREKITPDACAVSESPKFIDQLCNWFSKTLLNRSTWKSVGIKRIHWAFIWLYKILQLCTGKQAAPPHPKWVDAPYSIGSNCIEFEGHRISLSFGTLPACGKKNNHGNCVHDRVTRLS